MLFHKHKFQKDDRRGILWCECGKIKTLPKENCNHEWRFYARIEKTETNRHSGAKQDHTVDTLFCKNCGKIKFIDIVKGEEIKKENLI